MTSSRARQCWRATGVGLFIALTFGTLGLRSDAADPRKPVAPIYHNKRAFRIPFNSADPSYRSRLKEIRLFGSDDYGVTWKVIAKATPDDLSVAFRAPKDGEYWFAVISVDLKGRLTPSTDAEVEPNMKVVVNTQPPRISLEPLPRRGANASVRWELRDEHLDLDSLVLEYQFVGAKEWRQVPVRRPALIGMESWNANTAEPIKVRLTVSDKAGNSKEETLTLGDGTPRNPAMNDAPQEPDISAPPALGSFASDSAERPTSATESGPPTLPGLSQPPRSQPGMSAPPAMQAPDPGPAPAPFRANDAPPVLPNSAPQQPPVVAPAPAPTPAQVPVQPSPNATNTPTPAPGSMKPELVPSPKFSLQYAVDDAGASGPASVELWISQDGGRNWSRKDEDPDRVSPFLVNLGGEGTFGLRLVARSSSGQGDLPPAPGDLPHLLIEVDSTPPVVRLDPVKVVNAPDGVKLTITWHASDLHLGPRCVLITWRPDEPGARWETVAAQIDNTGQYVWSVPPTVPTKFHLRVDVMDSLGNRGWAESTDMGPINIDRTRPKSRILGLQPLRGNGPSARPMR